MFDAHARLTRPLADPTRDRQQLRALYADRPVVCRVHHSLEDSAAGCEGGRQPEAVDLTEIYVGELRMMGRMMIYADIREFFPHSAA